MARSGSRRATAARTAQAGPSNVAKNPSPAVSRLPALKPRELATNYRVMLLQEHAPTCVSETRRQLRRTHDVGEQDRGEHALRLIPSAEARRMKTLGGLHRREVGLLIHPRCKTPRRAGSSTHLGSADAGRRAGVGPLRPWHLLKTRYSDGRETSQTSLTAPWPSRTTLWAGSDSRLRRMCQTRPVPALYPPGLDYLPRPLPGRGSSR